MCFLHLSQASRTEQWNKRSQLLKGKQGPRTNQIELTWLLAQRLPDLSAIADLSYWVVLLGFPDKLSP